jgi:hypothetical protein
MTRKYIDIAVGGIVAVLVLVSLLFTLRVPHASAGPSVPVCDVNPLAHQEECGQP